MKKILLGILGLVLVVVIAAAVALMTFDPNKYKGKIIEAVNKQTGRTLALEGDLELHLSLSGLILSMQKASLSNPEWASRPTMASIGEFDLGVALLPLINHQLVISRLVIKDADILLEQDAKGNGNWIMGKPKAAAATPSHEKEGSASPQPSASTANIPSIAVDSVMIESSRFGMRGKDGQYTRFELDKLSVKRAGLGAKAELLSRINGVPLALQATAKDIDLTAKSLSIGMVLEYAKAHLTLDGALDMQKNSAAIKAFTLAVGKTELQGTADIRFGEARPAVRIDMTSAHVDVADLKMLAPPTAQGSDAAAEPKNTASANRSMMLSAAALPFAALQALEAKLSVKIGELVLPQGKADNVELQMDARNNHVNLETRVASFAGGAARLKSTLDVSSLPAHLNIDSSVTNIDAAQLLPLLGMDAFLSAKANLVMAVASVGNSPHELAQHATGNVSLVSPGGKVLLDNLNPAIVQLVSSGSGSTLGLNCLAARFGIQNGLVVDRGVLADTTVSTVLVKGTANLGAETNDLTVYARPRLAKIDAFVPPVHIGGSFLQPNFTVVATNVIKNVAGMLLGGGKTAASPVPDMQVPPAQENACVYTLDHPVAAKATPAASSDSQGKSPKLKDIGKGLLKGFLGQ